jgi:hypothetical protein
MPENFYTILTNVGLAKLANAIPLQQPINLTSVKVGDSGGAYRNPAVSDEDVVGVVWTGPINSLYIDPDNPTYMIVETLISADAGPFYVREVGVFDAAGDMIAIGKYPETYKPALTDGAGKDLYVKFIMEVTNTAAVTLRIDPSIVLATRQYADSLMGTSATTRRITQSGLVLANDVTLMVDATGGNVDLTFLSATPGTARGIKIKRVDTSANRVRLLPQSGQTIEWQSYIDIADHSAYYFQPDGVNNWMEMTSNDLVNAPAMKAQQNGGTVLGGRHKVNFIPGDNITVTVADDSLNDRINVTIAQSGSSSPIKSIQRGVANVPSGSLDITINQVDITKAILIGGASTGNGPGYWMLINATTIRVASLNGIAIQVPWTVLEFN